MEGIAKSKMYQLSSNLLSGRLVFSSSQAVSRPRYARMQCRTGSAPQSVRRRQPSRQSGRLDTGGSEVESGEDGPQAGRYPFPQESSVQCETKTHQRLTLRSFQDAEHGSTSRLMGSANARLAGVSDPVARPKSSASCFMRSKRATDTLAGDAERVRSGDAPSRRTIAQCKSSSL
jgi:hypothetical protein